MKRRILAPVLALVVAVGGIWVASAGAQTEQPPQAPLGTWCPIPASPTVGPLQGCKVVPDPDWTPPTTTPTTTTTTSSTTTTVPTTTPPVTTTTTSTPPDPEPPATLMGWQLSTTNVGLAPHGLTCMGLPLYSGPSKLAAGQTYSGLRFELALDFSAGNVTVEKSCIKPRNTGVLRSLSSTTVCPRDCEVGLPAGTKATVRDSEIDGSYLSNANVAWSCAFDGIADLFRNYMHDVGSGICFRATDRDTNRSTSGVVAQNYVHRLRHYGDAHHDGGTIRDFRKDSTNSRSLVFVNNRFDSTPINTSGWQTGAFFIQPTYSGYGVHNVWLDGNYFEGGGYNLRLEQSAGGNGNTHSTNNRFRPTEYGPSNVSGSPGWSEWRDNYRYDPARFNAMGAVVQP